MMRLFRYSRTEGRDTGENAAQINAKRKQKRKVQRVILGEINIRQKVKRNVEG
jgi:hypothetical protein